MPCSINPPAREDGATPRGRLQQRTPCIAPQRAQDGSRGYRREAVIDSFILAFCSGLTYLDALPPRRHSSEHMGSQRPQRALFRSPTQCPHRSCVIQLRASSNPKAGVCCECDSSCLQWAPASLGAPNRQQVSANAADDRQTRLQALADHARRTEF